jgi:molybdopterin synthase catalytic subunit
MRAALVRQPIDPVALLREAQRPGNGAAVLFVGTVRDVNDGRAVTGMEYTAYEAMAERELRRVLSEAVARFETDDLVVEHRLGALEVGDVSVAIVAGHPHRARAFDAARYVIEELKRRIPVWKLEHYVDGTREWVDPTAKPAPAAVTEGS